MDRTDPCRKMPKPFYRPTSTAFSIDEILYNKGRTDINYKGFQQFKGEYLFRFKIPPFQRGFIWTEYQAVKFIESAWLGFSLGSYLVNKLEWKGKLIPEYDDFLLDGLQRIKAIHDYVNDEFKVLGYTYSELTEQDTAHFESITFTQDRVQIKDIEKLKELYNRLNFGGTPHTENERA